MQSGLVPNSDLQTFKKRPALIVQADDLQTNLPQVIVALITSNMTRANHKSRAIVLLNSPEGRQSGLQERFGYCHRQSRHSSRKIY